MITLDDLLLNYLAYLRGLRRKATSLRMFEAHGRALTRHFGPTFSVADLTQEAIAEFVDAQLTRVSAETVNNELAVLRASLKWAASLDAPTCQRLAGLPCNVRLLKRTRKRPTVLSVEQVSTLISHAKPPYDTAILLAAHAGLRQAEIRFLHTDDVDLDEGVVRVRAKAGWSPKSGEEREVPLNSLLRAELGRYLVEARPSGWLFPGIDGPLDSMCAPVRAAFKAAGLYTREDRPGLHMLRRTFASNLLGGGVDLATVMELGGWSNLATVQRYLASTDERKRSAVEVLG